MMQTIKMENLFDSQVKILKMVSKKASKMAASNAFKTYLTKSIKRFNLDFLWLFRGRMIQMIKMENWCGSEGSNI